jgi:hypothetical protein
MAKLGRTGQAVAATLAALVLTASALGAAVEPARAIDAGQVSLVAAGISDQAVV